jgi:hypothetical protein
MLAHSRGEVLSYAEVLEIHATPRRDFAAPCAISKRRVAGRIVT